MHGVIHCSYGIMYIQQMTLVWQSAQWNLPMRTHDTLYVVDNDMLPWQPTRFNSFSLAMGS